MSDDTEHAHLWDHVGVLRNHIIWGGIIFLAIVALVFFYGDIFVTELIVAPLQGEKLFFLSPLDPFLFKVKIAFYAGTLLSFPLWLGQFLHFAAPALPRAKRIGMWLFASASLVLATISLLVTYLYFIPLTLEVLKRFTVEGTEFMLTADKYLSFCILEFLLVFIVFQIPIVVASLSYMKIINPHTLSRYRRASTLSIVTVLAVVTPTTDIITLAMVSIVALLLWEIGIFVSKIVYNK